MNKFKNMALAVATMGFIATAPVANAIPFTITNASFTPGAGYGDDSNENGGTLLDVGFSTSGFSTQTFALNNPADFFTFIFGTIDFRETDAGNGANVGINNQEDDFLGVTASFTFTAPLGITQNALATGTAFFGPVGDDAVDYTLVWTPVLVDFGTGGQFEISMDSRSFSNIGLQNQSATITLRSLPVTAGIQAVPEPATLALLGVGLLGFAATRRKSAKNNSV